MSEPMTDNERQLLSWVKRDGNAIRAVWLKEGKGRSLTEFTLELWNKKKRFSDILSGKINP